MAEGQERIVYTIESHGADVLIRDVNGATKSIDGLERELKKADKELAEANKNYKEASKFVNQLQKEYTTYCEKLEKAKNAHDSAKVKEYNDKLFELKETIQEEKKNLDDCNKALDNARSKHDAIKDVLSDAKEAQKQLNKEYGASSNALERMLGGTRNYQTILSALPPGIRSVATEITGMTRAAMAFLATPLGIAIGALSLALSSVYQWFTRTSEGEREMARITGELGQQINEFKDSLADVGEVIYKTFNGDIFKGFGSKMKKYVFDQFKELAEEVMEVGALIKAAFTAPEKIEGESFGDTLKRQFEEVKTHWNNIKKIESKHLNENKKEVEGRAYRIRRAGELNEEEKDLRFNKSDWETSIDKSKNGKKWIEQREAELRIQMRSTTDAKERNEIEQEAIRLIELKYKKEKTFLEQELKIQEERNGLGNSNDEDKMKVHELRGRLADLKRQMTTEKGFYQRLSASSERSEESKNKAQATKDTRAQEKANAERVHYNEILRAQEEYYKDLERQTRDGEFAVRRAEIDGMKDGFNKKMSQLKLQYDMEIAAIEDKKARMIKNAQENEERLWKAEHPDYARKGLIFNPTAGLSDAQTGLISDETTIANSKYNRGQQELLEQLQREFATVEQKMDEIHRVYGEKRRAMYTDDSMTTFKEGFSRENLDNLNAKEKEAVDAVNQEIAEKEQTFQTWMASIANMSIEQLRIALQTAKDELAKVGADPNANPKEVAVAKAKVNTAQKKLDSVSTKNQDKSLKKWQQTYKVLHQVSRELNEIGDQFGGLAGKAIKTASSIATSTTAMVGGIKELTRTSTDAIEGTAKAAEKAIKGVERASVILAVISAAMEVFTALFNAFSGSNMDAMNDVIEENTAAIKDLQGAIDTLTEKIEQSSGQAAVDAYNEAVEMTKKQEAAASSSMVAEASKWERGSHSINSQLNNDKEFLGYMKQVSDLLGKDIKTSQEYLSLTAEELAKIRDTNYDLFAKIQSAYRGAENGHTGENVDEMINDYIATYSKAVDELSEQLVESLTGLSLDSISEDWKSLLADMDTSSRDFAQNFQDYMRQAIVNSIVKENYSKRLEELTQEFARKMEDGSMTAEESAQLQASYAELYSAAMSQVNEALEAAGLSDLTDQDFSRGVGSMSEQTAEELNGRFTALQISGQQLVAGMEEVLVYTREGIDYLGQIARNTGELYEMNERLGKIVDNTSAL